MPVNEGGMEKNELYMAIAAALAELKRESAEITLHDASPAESRSRFGGEPDLPADFVWPRYFGMNYADDVEAERPLAFLAQIDLSQVRLGGGLLPESGLLSFFYELESSPWGFDPKNAGCARVYYFPEGSVLSRRALPEELAEECRLPAFGMSFKTEDTLPDIETFCDTPQGAAIAERFGDIDCDDYCEARRKLGFEEKEGVTRLLGWPETIQGAMEYECEAVSRGIYMGGLTDTPPEVRADIRRKSGEWTLLFQLASVECGGYELMFGDLGTLYFWIRRQDLAERRFDSVWPVLQCG